ncbi:MAG: hypothetical protein DRQ08_06790 [Candidatus Latescibacterota bacterium]|nr:MAG: hypothetical protein DRQ08_06790 [Candidatus Latescibacterota bacterium]
MLQKPDLNKVLKIWGPIKAPVDRESIKLWGSVDRDSIIRTYKDLSIKDVELICLKYSNKKQEQ